MKSPFGVLGSILSGIAAGASVMGLGGGDGVFAGLLLFGILAVFAMDPPALEARPGSAAVTYAGLADIHARSGWLAAKLLLRFGGAARGKAAGGPRPQSPS